MPFIRSVDVSRLFSKLLRCSGWHTRQNGHVYEIHLSASQHCAANNFPWKDNVFCGDKASDIAKTKVFYGQRVEMPFMSRWCSSTWLTIFFRKSSKPLYEKTWIRLSASLIWLNWSTRNEYHTRRNILYRLCEKLSELADIETGWDSSSDVLNSM